MRLNEEIQIKLTILSVKEWEVFQVGLRSLGRLGRLVRKARSDGSGTLLKKFVGGAMILAMLLPFPAWASADEAPAVMEEVVVTATRNEQELSKFPGTVKVITAEEIKLSNANTVPDVLRTLPGVLIRDTTGSGNEQAVDIGGFGEAADRHVAVLINGRRTNSVDMSNISWATIPVENIARIEVLYGSGAVLYGDNAMGGVINIITKEASREGLHGNVNVGYGSFETLRGGAEIDVVSSRSSLHLGVAHQETDGYRDRSESERNTVFANLLIDPAENTNIFFDASFSHADYQLPGALTKAEMEADRRQAVYQFDEGDGEDLSLVAGVKQDMGELGKVRLEFSYREQDRDADMDSWSSFMTFKVVTRGVTPQYTIDKSLAGHDNRLTAGIDYYDTDYETYSGFTAASKSNHKEYAKETSAVYLQDEFQFTQNLSLNVGGRHERSEFDLPVGTSSQVIAEEQNACNTGLAYNFSGDSKLYGRTYRSFRYPVVDEYVTYGVINPDLKPEKARGYEAGMNLNFGRKTGLTMRTFMMDVEDAIAYNYLTSLNENLDETRHEGIELGARFRAGDMVTLSVGAAYLNVEFSDGSYDGKKVPLVPEWKGNSSILLSPSERLTAQVQYTYVGKRYAGGDNTNTFEKLDGYNTVDISTNYLFNDMIDIFAVAKNIFGEKYSEFAFDYGFVDGYYPMPEESLFVGIRTKF